MSDIWSNVGAGGSTIGGDWLYRKGGQIHGPMPEQAVVDRLLRGDIGLKTPVAREGGPFHPLGEVAAFSSHLEKAAKILGKRTAARTLRIVFGVLAVVLVAGAGATYYIWTVVAAEEKARATTEAADAKKRKEHAKALDEDIKKALDEDVKLVALVSFDEKRMKVGGGKPGKPGKPGSVADSNAMVSSCQRGQKDIISVLVKSLAKINVCVQAEKARTPSMPATLPLEFVVLPTGKVTDFEVGHRFYRTGPMKNCMVKVFRGVKYPSAGGSNCPVSIPIKVGS